MTLLHSCLFLVATDTRLFICKVWVCRNSLPRVAAARNVSMMWSSLSFVLAIDFPSPAPARLPPAGHQVTCHDTGRVSRDRVTSRDTSWHVSPDCRRVSPCVAQLASEIFLAANEIFSSRLQGQKAITEVTVKVRLIIYQRSGFDLTSDTGHKDEERNYFNFLPGSIWLML